MQTAGTSKVLIICGAMAGWVLAQIKEGGCIQLPNNMTPKDVTNVILEAVAPERYVREPDEHRGATAKFFTSTRSKNTTIWRTLNTEATPLNERVSGYEGTADEQSRDMCINSQDLENMRGRQSSELRGSATRYWIRW